MNFKATTWLQHTQLQWRWDGGLGFSFGFKYWQPNRWVSEASQPIYLCFVLD